VRYFLQFPKNCRQVASSFEHVRNLCEITATNCTEIALKLQLASLAIFIESSSATKIALKKGRQKLHKKSHVQTGFNNTFVFFFRQV